MKNVLKKNNVLRGGIYYTKYHLKKNKMYSSIKQQIAYEQFLNKEKCLEIFLGVCYE
jgi:hypothetical protein